MFTCVQVSTIPKTLRMGKYYSSKRYWKTVANNKTKAKSHKHSDWNMNEPGQEKAQATEKPV